MAGALKKGGCYDLAIEYGDPDGEADVIEDLYAFGKPGWFTSSKSAIPIEDLAKHPLMVPSPSRYRELLEDHFAKAGHAMQVDQELEMSDAMISFAKTGKAVAILSYANIHEEVEQGLIQAVPIWDGHAKRGLYFRQADSLNFRLKSSIKKALNQAFIETESVARWRLS